MSALTDNKAKVKELKTAIIPLRAALTKATKELEHAERELGKVESELAAALSIEFVARKKITADDVVLSDAPNVPWFGHIKNFIEWLKKNPTKQRPYIEWNGHIYITADLLEGRWKETPALMEHIKGLAKHTRNGGRQ